jgi:hypothetical protein
MVSSAAPPIPWTTRPASSTPYAGASALSAAPTANSRPPIVSTGRSPNRSPSRPTARIETANGSTYALTAQRERVDRERSDPEPQHRQREVDDLEVEVGREGREH